LNRSPSPASVTVTVPARLHLGFLDLNGGLGRRFGSIGLAINGLKTSITFNAASQLRVTGPENERVRGYLQVMQRALDIENTCHVRIDEVVPAHAGLGSGTQIALAVAAGVRRFHGLPLDVRGDAIRLERGARSGVGIGLFDHGGLVVDGGRGPLTTAAPVVSRMPFPEQWRILVVLDPHRQGVHGPDEREVFSKLAPSSDGQAAHLCRLVLMKALPALAECDIAGFGSAIKEMQMLLGDYFATIQGGSRFSSPDVAAALAALEDEGAYGIGQSSWGPTGFAFAPSAEEANRLVESVNRHPRCRDLDIRTVAGLNRGAHIVSHAEADEPERHQR
jgi:beta-ribofuranosylaminobenzene 5'-phosphate synthase